MSELSLTHCKYECKYHVVFAPKFRRQIRLPLKTSRTKKRTPQGCSLFGAVDGNCVFGGAPPLNNC